MIICIESFHQKALETVLTEVHNQLLSNNFNCRVVQFPSQGPFGHQIRVVEDGRVQLNDIPLHLLRMVDRMDLFLNPTNGLALSKNTKEIILLTESHFKESLLTLDPEMQKWIIEINSNLPTIEHVFWLAEEKESIPPLSQIPRITQLFTMPTSLKEAAAQIVEFIIHEVNND
jgi:hypothetical protein